MSQVAHTMRIQVPVAEWATAEIEHLMEQIDGASGPEAETLKERLDRLAGGAPPGVVRERLRAFLDAMSVGDSMTAIRYWVKVAPVLKVVNG